MRIAVWTQKLTRFRWKPWIVFWVKAGASRYSWVAVGKREFVVNVYGFCIHNYQPYSYTDKWEKSKCHQCGSVKVTTI